MYHNSKIEFSQETEFKSLVFSDEIHYLIDEFKIVTEYYFSFQLINTPFKKRIIKARFYQRIRFRRKEDYLSKPEGRDLAILFSFNTFVFR
ncbi:MAG: hypothetical protein BGO84_13630 [Dysgonomonas sp. 37-18]|nr:MAG: hypothetical protein BGO84_13630 [Dysgonomonas sp. 37-18]